VEGAETGQVLLFGAREGSGLWVGIRTHVLESRGLFIVRVVRGSGSPTATTVARAGSCGGRPKRMAGV
jgi:hypothetical protein